MAIGQFKKMWQCSNATWWPTLKPYLIFVTDVTDGVCGEKLFMWRNSPHVVKWKISPHDKCGETLSHGEISPHYKCGEICQVENFSTWERWRKSVMWRNFSSWEMWRKYVKPALSNCLKMALYHQGQQIRLLSNQGAQGGTAQPTFLLLNLSVISFSITI